MIMTTWQGVVTVLMAVLGTVVTRFLPFLLSLSILAKCCRMP